MTPISPSGMYRAVLCGAQQAFRSHRAGAAAPSTIPAMHHRPHLLLPVTAAFLLSCGGPGHDHADHAPAAQDSATTADQEALPAVTLDNGQRWKANPETTAGIASMQRILGAYDPAGGDPKALKAALEEEFGLIFERCTMTGEAHEQLHNYLLPIHHQLRDFAGTEAQRADLRSHLAAYATYFE